MKDEMGFLDWMLFRRHVLSKLVFLGLTLINVSLYAQNSTSPNRGIIFRSFDVDPIDRTSLDISEALTAPLESIAFDLSLNGFSSFGYIFRALTSDGSNLDFLYTPNEGGWFKLILDGRETSLNLAIGSTEARRNHWRSIQLTFNETEILLESGGQTLYHPTSKQLEIVNLIFGVNDLPELQTVDCPPFIIRDLKVTAEGAVTHHWPMEESYGDELNDIIAGQPLNVSNGEWRVAQSFRWKPVGEMNGPMSLIIGHDPFRQRILWVHPESIQSFDLTNGYSTRFDLESDIESRFGLYDEVNDQLITYDMEPVGVSQIQIDTTAQIIAEKLNPRAPVQNLWLSAAFVNPLDSNLMLLGGYGFFTSKNSLWSYDRSNQEWSQVQLKGDTLEPRYHHAIAAGPELGQFYVFGGIGNLTGKQELGLQHYYDLHLLDMRDSSMKKVWEMPEIDTHFSTINQMVFSEEEEVLYVLGYRAFGEVNNLALLKISIDEPSLQAVGDSIPFAQKGFDRTQSGLFQNKGSEELIAYTLVNEEHLAKLKLYSILFPPMGVPDQVSSSSGYSWYWLTLLLPVFLIVAVLRRRKEIRAGRNMVPVLKETEKNTIRLWGGFTVYDKNGLNISEQFSPKIKELFLLLFFNSIGEGRGIKAQKIYEKIWPGHDRAKAKNALGVTMGRLRTALHGIESVQVVNENGVWKLLWKNQLPTDYHVTLLSLEQLQQQFSEAVLDGLVHVVERGSFLPNTEIEWLDDYKGKVNFRVTNSLIQISDRVAGEERNMKIADIILTIDDLHEQAARLKIRALTTLGKHGLAKYFYEEFSKRYLELYQEAFPYSFKEMKG